MENCRVTINGIELEYAKGTTFLEISREFQKNYEHDIILAFVNGKLSELAKGVTENCTLKFVTTAETAGAATYMRGMILVMLRAFYRVFDSDTINKVCVEHSIGKALYCELDAKFTLTEEQLEDVRREMRSLVERDLPIKKRSIKTEEAKELFNRYRMYDKEKLFDFRRVSNTNIYNLDGFDDYYYGYMPATTGVLKYFDLIMYDNGFLLMLPDKSAPEETGEFEPKELFFNTQQESNRWGKMIGIETVGDLNEQITKGNISELILVQEALQEKNIGAIAEKIRDAGGRKIVLIAGPSSSGKTTFSHRLSIQLRTLGYKPHPVALDNYFVNREDTPKDEDGNYNFECLEAIDVQGFNNDMTALLNGETVSMPSFNFKSGKREYKGNTITLGKDDILVIEGIHGLNDELSYSLPVDSRFKVYISALTQLNIDEHNRIPTTDGRLIRRMVRDARTRGTGARETIAMWASVRRGEEQNIFPFQEEADCMFNSALIYELAVLKQFAEPLLFGIQRDCEEYLEAKRLLKFLDYFLGVSSEEIPRNSIIREFVGGSVFNV